MYIYSESAFKALFSDIHLEPISRSLLDPEPKNKDFSNFQGLDRIFRVRVQLKGTEANGALQLCFWNWVARTHLRGCRFAQKCKGRVREFLRSSTDFYTEPISTILVSLDRARGVAVPVFWDQSCRCGPPRDMGRKQGRFRPFTGKTIFSETGIVLIRSGVQTYLL